MSVDAQLVSGVSRRGLAIMSPGLKIRREAEIFSVRLARVTGLGGLKVDTGG
jgi:hypothetical protein